MSREAIDISRTIAPGALVYPGDKPPAFNQRLDLSQGDPYNILEFQWSGHVLTHVDAPRHFLPEGETVDQIPPERFMGDAEVIEVDGPVVQPEHVPQQAAGLNLLFKTRNSLHWEAPEFDTGYVYISPAAAETIAERGANLVGIDYLSVDRFGDETYPVHQTLLGADILILEGIDLSGVQAGRYTLIAVPLKISGGDGSPVRALLLPPDETSFRAE